MCLALVSLQEYEFPRTAHSSIDQDSYFGTIPAGILPGWCQNGTVPAGTVPKWHLASANWHLAGANPDLDWANPGPDRFGSRNRPKVGPKAKNWTPFWNKIEKSTQNPIGFFGN